VQNRLKVLILKGLIVIWWVRLDCFILYWIVLKRVVFVMVTMIYRKWYRIELWCFYWVLNIGVDFSKGEWNGCTNAFGLKYESWKNVNIPRLYSIYLHDPFFFVCIYWSEYSQMSYMSIDGIHLKKNMIISGKYYLTSISNIHIFIGLWQLYRNNRKISSWSYYTLSGAAGIYNFFDLFYWLWSFYWFITILYFMECIYNYVANATKYVETVAKITKSFDIVLFLLYRKIQKLNQLVSQVSNLK
jgi:hypothetical protein